VRALTAHENRGGTKILRKLEMHLLQGGVTVSRTADDLVRYHGKMMIIDARILHVYCFNFTLLDMEKSRSFGVVTKNRKLVTEAMKLFEADFERQPYRPGCDRFVVSPENARERLAAFIKGARKQLLIYDANVCDDAMLRIITERIKAGVDVKIIGSVEAKWKIHGEPFPGKRMHVRAIVRDGKASVHRQPEPQALELENRREVGVIITDPGGRQSDAAVLRARLVQDHRGKEGSKEGRQGGQKGEERGEARRGVVGADLRVGARASQV